METQSINAINKSIVNDVDLCSPGIHKICVDGLQIRYEINGTGKPLLLMHGWGCTLETVRSVAETASQNHMVVNIDFPGFGESDEPESVWGVKEYTGFIEKFIEKLGLKNLSLAGHSFGGRVAILYSSRNDVEKVILIDAAGVKPKHPWKWYIKVYSFKTAKFFVRLFLPNKKATEIIDKMRNRRGSADYNAASPKMKSILSKVVNEDLKHVLHLIKAPTLLIWGKNDTATPVADAKIMERLIPDAGLVVFENAGHYSFLDNPFGFKRVLKSFLNAK